MNLIKKIVSKTVGYWVHKLDTLPVGADLFYDIQEKIGYKSLNVLFDVGANVGQTRNWFRYYKPHAKIFCFEPVKSTFGQLVKNSKHDCNCVLENLAFAEKSGEKTIRLFEANLAVLNSLNDFLMNNRDGAKEERIKVETLDNYCESNMITKIDLLKIDTEGYDVHVLQGAKKMMEREAISMIYCEAGFHKFNQRNTSFNELSKFLEERNYFFFGLYQVDYRDWKNGNNYGNALYVHKNAKDG
jgi:FkbM family methyltransferase